jgi:hypothetical protein
MFRQGISLGKYILAIDRAIERHKSWVILVFSAAFCAICSMIAATKMMWFDEMATYYPAKLPAVSDLLRFFREGLDVHTPTASLVLRGDMALFGDSALAIRIPVIAGYLVMCLCIFLFVARRAPAVYAAAAMIFPALTGVFYYATEMRCYGLLLGLTGVAMVCWQQASENRFRAASVGGLFLSLAGAICCHYYAVLLWIPFGLAELTRTWQRRRADGPVWAALLLSPLIVLIFLPGIHAARGAYGGNFWSRPRVGQVLETYQDFLALAFAPMVGAVIVWLLLVRFARPVSDLPARPPLAERVLAGSLALLPVFALPVSYLAGVYVSRYVLPTVAGLAVFLAFSLCWAFRGDRLAGLVVTMVFAAWFVQKGAGTVKAQNAVNGGFRTPLAQPFQNTPWMKVLESSSLPVAATPAVFFMKLQHYAPEGVRERVSYPADEQIALKYEGIFTGETNLLRFSRMLPIRVPAYREYLARYPRFLVCAETTNPTWLLRALVDEGAEVRLLERSGTYFVFEASLASSRQ